MLLLQAILGFETRPVSMTDEEYRQQVQKRWQESMALLGIEDAGPAPEPQKKAPEPPPKMAPAARLPEPDFDEMEVPVSARDQAPRAQAPSHRDDYESRRRTEPEPEIEAPRLAPGPASEPGEEPVARTRPSVQDAEDDRGPRRRGRRGRGRKKPEAGTPEEQGVVAEAPEPGEDDAAERDSRGRRGRGRPRQRPAKPAEPQAISEDEPEPDEPANDRDFGDDEPTDLSEWDVPSWQELIASLYRPER
jgi:hypothetical protein